VGNVYFTFCLSFEVREGEGAGCDKECRERGVRGCIWEPRESGSTVRARLQICLTTKKGTNGAVARREYLSLKNAPPQGKTVESDPHDQDARASC